MSIGFNQKLKIPDKYKSARKLEEDDDIFEISVKSKFGETHLFRY